MRKIVLLVLAFVPVPFSDAFAVTPLSLPTEDQLRMYSVIVGRLLDQDDTYGEPIGPGKVYVSMVLSDVPSPGLMKQIENFDDQTNAARTDASVAPPKGPPPFFDSAPEDVARPHAKLTDSMRAPLVSAINLPQYEFAWVVNPDKDLKFDKKTGALPDGRPVLTLSRLIFLTPDRIYASGNIYVASQVSGVCWYFFKRDSSGWHFEKRIRGPVS